MKSLVPVYCSLIGPVLTKLWGGEIDRVDGKLRIDSWYHEFSHSDPV